MIVSNAICQFRTANNRLPIVIGRYQSIPHHQRLCTVCDNQQVGDEYHLLVECFNPTVVKARHLYQPEYILKRPSVAKCADWIKNLSVKQELMLGKFLVSALNIFK